MVTQKGNNTSVVAIHGNFDNAQSGVKEIFEDKELEKELAEAGYQFSSANSINIGRLVPQVVYYVYAYAKLLENEEITEGEELNVTVPTGNFGNILAAFYAKEMGLPVGKLICASNSNDVLTEFIRTGVYNRNRPFHTTISPSMDILVSSNLERLLYHLTGGKADQVRQWMQQLAQQGYYRVDPETMQKITDLFWAGSCGDEDTLKSIREMYQVENYLCDSHTAVAVHVYEEYVKATGDSQTPTVVVSTASPYKFPESVLCAITGKQSEGEAIPLLDALSALTGTAVPEPLHRVREKAVRFSASCAPESMAEVVLATLG